jgi:hypothetical protein
MELTKKYLINGPNNVIRLTNGEKIIYIFGDIHFDINNQRKCTDNNEYDSINFDQFLIKFMKENTENNFDLFIEQTIDQIKYFNVDINDIYINNIRKIFSKNINFVNNKIIKSELYSNFNFHYFDFRSEFPEFLKIIDLINNLPEFSLIFENIDNIINTVNMIKTNINDFIKNINENSENIKVQKIYLKYENKKIQKKIINIINTYFKKIFYNETVNIIDELLDYIYTNYDTIKNKYLSNDFKLEIMFEIEEKMVLISRTFYDIFQLSDIYLIRRILDKKYVKKSIIYTGLSHLSLTIYFLVKYFDFEITNIYYLSNEIKNIKELEKIIKNSKEYYNLTNYFYNTNDLDEPHQCINLFNFPINMS